jgi:hypothetical protein
MQYSDVDEILAALLDGVSEEDLRVPLTVSCGGLVVSGTAVPEEVYFQTFGISTWARTTKEEREANNQILEMLDAAVLDRDIPVAERLAQLERAEALRRHFISLVDVTILGAGPIPIKAPAWRGRLSQISGWVLGTVDESESSPEPQEASGS